MISFQTSVQRAAIGAVLILGSLGLAVTPGHAAPPAPPAPPASYVLYGDATNTGSGSTNFISPGPWLFESTNDSTSTIMAFCQHGTFCTGVNVLSSAIGVSASVTNSVASTVKGIWGEAHYTTAGGTSYGGYFTASNRPTAEAVGVYAEGRTGVSAHGTTGKGIYAASSADEAILAQSYATNSAGIRGVGNGSGVTGQGKRFGVYGQVLSPIIDSIAVAGMISSSLAYAGVFTNPTGTALWGISTSDRGVVGTSTSYYGVVGSSGNNVGVRAASTSGTGLYATTTSGSYALRAKHLTGGSGTYAGYFEGNVVVTGNFEVLGTKNNRVPTSKGDVLLYAEESTVTRYSDQGTATLKDGRAVITLDPLFAETVDLAHGYQVFAMPNSAETPGLAVVNKTATSFEIRELGRGKGNFSFDWRISALRKGYGTQRLAPAAPLPPAEK